MENDPKGHYILLKTGRGAKTGPQKAIATLYCLHARDLGSISRVLTKLLRVQRVAVDIPRPGAGRMRPLFVFDRLLRRSFYTASLEIRCTLANKCFGYPASVA